MKKTLKLIVMLFIVFTFLDVKAAQPEVSADGSITILTSSVAGTVDKDSYYVTNTGTIKVTNAKTDDTFKAYKILDAFYNSTSNVVTYEFTSDFKSFLSSNSNYKNLTLNDYYNLTSGDITSGSTQSNSTLDKLMSLYVSYIAQNSSVTGTSLTNTNGTVTGAVEVGAYLILPTTTNYVYSVMVSNVELIAADDGVRWKLKSSKIVAKVSDVGISKELSVSSATIGVDYTNTITATVPKYPTNAINTTYVINEVFDAGITLPNLTSIVMKDGAITLTNTNGTFKNASGDTVAVISISGQKMTITFTASNVSTNTITITYKTALNDSATIGESKPNSTVTTLTYSNEPYAISDIKKSLEVKRDVYTYGIMLHILGRDDSGGPIAIALPGMVFDVYLDDALTNKIGTITTGTDGSGILRGIAAGTYYLKNVKTASGYKLANTVSVGVGEKETADGYYSVSVKVILASTLPFTGGIGTILYTAIGLIVIVSSVTLFYVYRKRQDRELS